MPYEITFLFVRPIREVEALDLVLLYHVEGNTWFEKMRSDSLKYLFSTMLENRPFFPVYVMVHSRTNSQE